LDSGRVYHLGPFPLRTAADHRRGRRINYIRNSVKAVVDMYDGTVSFYIMDPNDPVLAVYRRAFPGVFKDLADLSADLKSHLRYPEDLFAIQAAQYETFPHDRFHRSSTTGKISGLRRKRNTTAQSTPWNLITSS